MFGQPKRSKLIHFSCKVNAFGPPRGTGVWYPDKRNKAGSISLSLARSQQRRGLTTINIYTLGLELVRLSSFLPMYERERPPPTTTNAAGILYLFPFTSKVFLFLFSHSFSRSALCLTLLYLPTDIFFSPSHIPLPIEKNSCVRKCASS